ncbi:MAG TPA: hypothetical protein VLZ50_14820 [Terracidiphilus sp.]|nr:hypothetical protein [Terracidiphilus sp.]
MNQGDSTGKGLSPASIFRPALQWLLAPWLEIVFDRGSNRRACSGLKRQNPPAAIREPLPSCYESQTRIFVEKSLRPARRTGYRFSQFPSRRGY